MVLNRKKHLILAFLLIIVLTIIFGCSNPDEGKIENIEQEIMELTKQIEEKDVVLSDNEALIKTKDTEINALKKELKLQENKVDDLTKEIELLKIKIEEAKPWFEMTENERKKREEELAKEKAAKEAAELAAREAEEKKGYNTGITFDQIARNPDDYIYKKVKFNGKVIQVLEGDSETQIRLAVNGDYNKIIFAIYQSDIINSRVLEDDSITIYGISSGLLSYQSTMGGTITIPSVVVEKIDQ